MLDATPTNYTFAYLYLTGANGWLRKTVDAITDGGVRLAQKDVEEMMEMAPGETGHGAAASTSSTVEEHQAALRSHCIMPANLAAIWGKAPSGRRAQAIFPASSRR